MKNENQNTKQINHTDFIVQYKDEQGWQHLQQRATRKAAETWLQKRKTYLPDEELRITEQTSTASISKGQIFYTSWGYDQTNYDFIIVLDISPTGKTATCQRVTAAYACCAIEDQDHTTNSVKPTNQTYGDTFTMKTEVYSDSANLRGTYADNQGKAGFRLDSFLPVEENRTYAETALGCGH